MASSRGLGASGSREEISPSTDSAVIYLHQALKREGDEQFSTNEALSSELKLARAACALGLMRPWADAGHAELMTDQVCAKWGAAQTTPKI